MKVAWESFNGGGGYDACQTSLKLCGPSGVSMMVSMTSAVTLGRKHLGLKSSDMNISRRHIEISHSNVCARLVENRKAFHGQSEQNIGRHYIAIPSHAKNEL